MLSLLRTKLVTITFKGSNIICNDTASLSAMLQMHLFQDTLIMYGKVDSKGEMPFEAAKLVFGFKAWLALTATTYIAYC